MQHVYNGLKVMVVLGCASAFCFLLAWVIEYLRRPRKPPTGSAWRLAAVLALLAVAVLGLAYLANGRPGPAEPTVGEGSPAGAALEKAR
jgi:hypothetical protein